MSEYFYCYSKRMAYFIMAFGIRYVTYSVNKRTNTPYYTFEKSKRLDQIIVLYKSVIHSV
jgi:hypothetical protein|nr:MAG TPA: hypothetical protein [Caudoviricetes sp.]